MPEQLRSAESSLRWWEFYVVRYAMGTIVGGIVSYILCSGNPLLKPLTSRPEYLAAFGLVYCYVASAPILVFHAGRFLLVWRGIRTLRWGCLPVVAACAVGTILWFLVPRNETPVATYTLFLFTLMLATSVICLQFVIMARALTRPQAMWDFYLRLSQRRVDSDQGGIVESYRHLREHGNSFFIVLLEVALGLILLATNVVTGLTEQRPGPQPTNPASFWDPRLLPSFVILVLWIMPAVFVWLIATQFERKFSEQSAPPAQPTVAPPSDQASK
jgi:hypothetical protein